MATPRSTSQRGNIFRSNLVGSSSKRLSKDHTPLLSKQHTLEQGYFKRSGSSHSNMQAAEDQKSNAGSKGRSKNQGQKKSTSGSVKIFSKKSSMQVHTQREGKYVEDQVDSSNSDVDYYPNPRVTSILRMENSSGRTRPISRISRSNWIETSTRS